MSVENLIEPDSFTFPENILLDLHDIIGILLRERLLSDTRFGRAKLLEVSDGAWPASSLPIEQQRAFIDCEAPKVGYFLKLLGEKPGGDEDSVVEPHIFLHEGLRTQRELDVEEVESIFWAVKNHDSGFLLHHALQLVLDYLPKSATLRIRTSDGYSFTSTPQSFMVAEMDVLPKKTIFINATHPRTVVNNGKKREIHMDQYVFGEHFFAEPWVCLVFPPEEKELSQKKPNRDDDKCVVLDINLPVLGARGPGGEPFALERRNVYHNKLLPRAGTEEDLDLTQSPRIHATSREKAQPAVDLAKRILGRLERFARKEEFYFEVLRSCVPEEGVAVS
ncbi:hypothetical protein ACEPAH_8962 [Sanghuangporus vaninii]